MRLFVWFLAAQKPQKRAAPAGGSRRSENYKQIITKPRETIKTKYSTKSIRRVWLKIDQFPFSKVEKVSRICILAEMVTINYFLNALVNIFYFIT